MGWGGGVLGCQADWLAIHGLRRGRIAVLGAMTGKRRRKKEKEKKKEKSASAKIRSGRGAVYAAAAADKRRREVSQIGRRRSSRSARAARLRSRGIWASLSREGKVGGSWRRRRRKEEGGVGRRSSAASQSGHVRPRVGIGARQLVVVLFGSLWRRRR